MPLFEEYIKDIFIKSTGKKLGRWLGWESAKVMHAYEPKDGEAETRGFLGLGGQLD